MSYSIEFTRQAEADLRHIYEYIAAELQSFQGAEKLLARLESKIFSLEQLPERHHRYPQEPWHSRGLRVMVVNRYCVFYIPHSEQKIVSIIRVIYGGRDIEKIFSESTDDILSEG